MDILSDLFNLLRWLLRRFMIYVLPIVALGVVMYYAWGANDTALVAVMFVGLICTICALMES